MSDKICVVGLGYVGLPLAIEFGKKYITIGFDINNKRIEEFLRQSIDYQDDNQFEKPKELAENFIKNYQETSQEFSEYELPWEATVTGKVMFMNPKIISMQFNTNMFTGGAHGYSSVNYLNFDAETGENLKENELFNSEFLSFAEKDFRKKQRIPQGSNINSTGMFFENDQFHLPQNIGITKDTVILHYNAYEIAPYAAGNFVMKYPKNEIQQYFKENNAIPKA